MAEEGTVETDSSPQVVSIGSAGDTVVSRVDDRITVTFPPQALDRVYKFKFTFEKIDVDRYEAYKLEDERCACVVGFSGILHVKNNMSRIPGPVTLTLPLLEESRDSKKYEVMFIRIKDYLQRSLGEPVPARDTGDSYSIQINDFSIISDNFSAWKVKKGVEESVVVEAAKYISGQKSLCSFLSFVNIDDSTPWLTLNCVDLGHIQSVTDSYKTQGLQEIPRSRSESTTLNDGSNFKIEFEANINPAPKADRKALQNGLTFQAGTVSDGVHFPFTVKSSSNKSVVQLIGKEGRHSLSFRLAWFEQKPITVTKPLTAMKEDSESDEDEMHAQYVHVGEDVYAEIQPEDSLPMIRVCPAEFRSDSISSLKKEKGQFISEICDISNHSGLEYDLHIPVHVPDTRLPPSTLYNVFVVNETGSLRIPVALKEWPEVLRTKTKTSLSVKARVGNWKSMAVIADEKNERVQVPSSGFTFHSPIDDNILLEFGENKYGEEESFDIKVKEVDQNRLRGYKKENPDEFGIIRSITSSIFLSIRGSEDVIRNVDVTLPIRSDDVSSGNDNTDVILIQCDKEGLKEVPVEKSEHGNYYQTTQPTNCFQWATVVRREKDKSTEALCCINYLNGNKNLCRILSFIRFDRERAMVRVDCASTFMVDDIVKQHLKEGFIEIPSSRSSDRRVENKERLKISLKGNLQIPFGVPKQLYSVTFLQYSVSNYTTFPIVKRRSSDASNYSVIDVTGEGDFTRHMFTFTLDQCGNTLSNESVNILVEQLSWTEWQKIGERLAVKLDVRDQKGKTDLERSQRLLVSWVKNNRGKDVRKLASRLVSALQSTGHDAIASVLRTALEANRTLTRSDFLEYV